MNVRSSRLLAVLTAAVLTLASGTIQVYASFCQPAEKAVQEACCPDGDRGMQTEDCTMDGCDCTFDSSPTQQQDSPAVTAGTTPTWDVSVTATSEQLSTFDDSPVRCDPVVTYRDRGPASVLAISGNGLRGPVEAHCDKVNPC